MLNSFLPLLSINTTHGCSTLKPFKSTSELQRSFVCPFHNFVSKERERMTCGNPNCTCGASCSCGSDCGCGKYTEEATMGVAPMKGYFAEGSENDCKCTNCTCDPCKCGK